jgi:glycosyltransferase involved in cell wall biosynthesis
MRIVMLSTSFPPEVGGIQSHVANLAIALSKQGHRLKVVTVRRTTTERVRDTFAGLEVIRVPQLSLPRTMTAQYLALSTGFLVTLCARGQVDIVHYHTYWPDAFTAFVVNKLVPTVYTAHESRFLIMAQEAKYQRRLRLALRPFQQVIAPSTELLDVARRLGVNSEKSVFIPNAVDSNKFSPRVERGAVREQYGIPIDHILILCPRRLVPKNGVDYLIESLSLLRRTNNSFHLIVVGEGPERKRLSERVRDLGLQGFVIFTGSKDNDELPTFYADADIVAIPSLKEATSIAGLEAMASGRAVVATDVGGLPEIIEDGATGLLVPPRNPEALSAAIRRLIESPSLRRQLGQAARARVEKEFTWDYVARETTRVYERALTHRRGGAVPGLAHA